MEDKARKDYIRFMENPDNIRRCDVCPENQCRRQMNPDVLPCGQFHCWVDLTVNQHSGQKTQ